MTPAEILREARALIDGKPAQPHRLIEWFRDMPGVDSGAVDGALKAWRTTSNGQSIFMRAMASMALPPNYCEKFLDRAIELEEAENG